MRLSVYCEGVAWKTHCFLRVRLCASNTSLRSMSARLGTGISLKRTSSSASKNSSSVRIVNDDAYRSGASFAMRTMYRSRAVITTPVRDHENVIEIIHHDVFTLSVRSAIFSSSATGDDRCHSALAKQPIR